MKTYAFLILVFIAAIGSKVYGQKDTTLNTVPFYWTFELGSSYLASAGDVKNHRAPFFPTASGSIYFNWNFPLGKTHTVPLSGFYLAPGLGLGASTFSINKNLSENNSSVTIGDISGSYEDSYIQGIYIDIPLDLRYLTMPDAKGQNFSFEMGAKFGKLLYTEKEIQVIDGDDIETHKVKNVGIMNPYRYGLNAKIGYRKIKTNKRKEVFGYSFSLIANYYLSDAFIENSGIRSKSFSIGAGLGFNFR